MLETYLDRLGLPYLLDRPLDEARLREIAAAHAARIPFENTRAHRGERISVQLDDILDRLITRREGGVCYELNGGLGWLLAELGADVELNAAQVLTGAATPGAGAGLPMSHVALIVTLPGGGDAFLIDVGFGGETIFRDVPRDGATVTTAHGSAYAIDRRPRRLSDFEGLAWWHSTSPGSRFMRSIIVSSTRAEGIATLAGKNEGGESLAWHFRDAGEVESRPVDAVTATKIAVDVFELTSPLPERIIRYAPGG